ncbi:transmembrane protein 161B [Macrosteles quadrilineatus]|uniref:transmembrane protein 161B n=1 Tax=Macrosteles quadrilineatus TaxID=74068 RepID=UPI0023E13427|nr:transmembrane protein 161B [Macrosteles quadrilineatus]
MALLGTQLVLTLVMVSIIQKISPHFSFSRWLICSTGLIRYLYPTNDELKTLARVPKEKPKGKKDHRGKYAENGKSGPETFHIPRNLDIELETAKVTDLDVIHLRYFGEYQWLLDFAVYALCVYVITEVYTFYLPLKEEVNLSMLWCLLVLFFAFKSLLILTVQYFQGSESVGERSTVIVTAFAYLLVSMMILIVDERNLESGLETAYASFNQSAAEFLDNHGLDSQGPASKLMLKLCLAVWCALTGALFTFPGLRVARMHWDSLRYCGERRLLWILLNISFIAPLFLVLMWIPPVTKEYFTHRVFTGMTAPLMSVPTFESLRLVLVIATVLLRVAVMPVYLQAYLNMAYHRVQEQKKEAGRITNVELQKKIAAVFYYMCVVTLQYISPLLMCLFLTLMYKTLGEYSWEALWTEVDQPECPAVSPTLGPVPSPDDHTVLQSAKQFTLALDSLKQVFTQEVFRGLLGFTTWWTCFTIFTSTSLGMLYQTYFANS